MVCGCLDFLRALLCSHCSFLSTPQGAYYLPAAMHSSCACPGFCSFCYFQRALQDHRRCCHAVLFHGSPERPGSSSPLPSLVRIHVYSKFIIRGVFLHSVVPQVTCLLLLPLPTSQRTVFCGQCFLASCRFSLRPCNVPWLHSTTTDKDLSTKSPKELTSRSATRYQQG